MYWAVRLRFETFGGFKMSTKEILGDMRWDCDLILNAKPDNICNAKSIFQEITVDHPDAREGAEIRCDLKGLKTRSKSNCMMEILVLVMDYWNDYLLEIDAIVFIPHYGHGTKTLAKNFDEKIKSAIEKSNFNLPIYAYKSKRGDNAVHLLREKLDPWEKKNDFSLMWTINTWNNRRDGNNSPGVTP